MPFVLSLGGLCYFLVRVSVRAFASRHHRIYTCSNLLLTTVFDSVARAHLALARNVRRLNNFFFFFCLNNFTGGWQLSRCTTISFR